ncbi:hypothetical protein O181_096311 [Austropuccinia psidii MF-1]|uniref:Uncharacterized protein n=1 Tax=Austropuccinia psidii MF-1 TaxID=1389203 RepID=A0A9Q3PE40_9BASI|nr:hypothetical protein [Austropuccinia psidii MF-1]
MPDPHHEAMILPTNLLNGHEYNTAPLISSSGSDSSLHESRSQDYSRPQVLMSPSPQIPFNLHYGYKVKHVECMSRLVEHLHLGFSTPASRGSIVTAENSGTQAGTGEKAEKTKEKKNGKRHKRSKCKGNSDTNPKFTNICTYIKDQDNYDQLFGKRTKTSIGYRMNTRAGVYGVFS